jgi:PTS system glucitol/sorbitol-specific IIA component
VTYYRSTVVAVGAEVAEMAAAGVVILFGEPLPEALADVAVVHRPLLGLEGHAIRAGDLVVVGDAQMEVTSVGDRATKNLDELGHVVLYINQDEQKTLPGAVNATGTLPVFARGQIIEFIAGA